MISPACSSILAEETNEVHAVVRHEREFIPNDPLAQYPVWLAVQTEMIDMCRLEASRLSDSNQRFMHAFVNQKPHALLSRVPTGNDFRFLAFAPRQG